MNTEEKKKQRAEGSAAQKGEKSFSSKYDRDAREAYERLVNREDFKYQPSEDPLYRTQRDNYRREGRLAMEDSIGKTSDLTGGYASSYAQSVGTEQYGAYLEKLNDLMPELYAGAYERYVAEENRLNERLNAAARLADAEYKRYSGNQQAQLEREKLDYQKKSGAYKNLADAISGSGYIPSDEELEAVGMSRELAEALSYEFMRANGLLQNEQGAAGEINYYNLHPTSPFDIGYRKGMFDNLLRRKS